jgi:hypothetical protein
MGPCEHLQSNIDEVVVVAAARYCSALECFFVMVPHERWWAARHAVGAGACAAVHATGWTRGCLPEGMGAA